MNDNFRMIDTVIANLDRLTVQGVHNMSLVIESINALGALRENLLKEAKDVQSQTA